MANIDLLDRVREPKGLLGNAICITSTFGSLQSYMPGAKGSGNRHHHGPMHLLRPGAPRWWLLMLQAGAAATHGGPAEAKTSALLPGNYFASTHSFLLGEGERILFRSIRPVKLNYTAGC